MQTGYVHADAEDISVQCVKLFHVVHKAHMFLSAGWAPVKHVEHDNHVFLSLEIRQLHFLVVLIFLSKIRGCLSDCYSHLMPPFANDSTGSRADLFSA